MTCYRNGETFINTLVPVPGATADSASYVLDLTHFLCGNRKVCASSAFPIAANLNYQVLSVDEVGKGVYNANIFVTGQVSYKPYRNGNNTCGCEENCYRTDNIWVTLSVPVTSQETPTITPGICKCAAANLRDCCSVSNAVGITTSFLVESPAAAQGGD